MKQLFYGAAIFAAIAGSGIASAQSNTPTMSAVSASGLAIRGGVVVPFDDNLRDISKTFVGIGAEYTFTHQFLANSETYISLDWIAKNINGGDSFYPVCINQRFYTGNSRYGSGRAYFFVGLGETFYNLGDDSKKLGGRGGIGMEFGPSLFFEGAAFFAGKDTGGTSGNAIGAYLGYRFK